MKRKIVILLVCVLTLSGAFGNSFVSRAENSETYSDETEALGYSENYVDAGDISSENSDSASDEKGADTTATQSVNGDAEVSVAAEDGAELSTSGNDVSSVSENSETESTEEDPQKTDNANSWRYQNGELIEEESDGLARAGSSSAWSKVNGVWVNSYGDAIPGATAKAIDVSVHQGKIDWEKLKAESDVDFVILRCGYGDNISSQDDKTWAYNVSECERLGIPYGVYIYSYATNTSMANSEADHVIRLLQGHNPQYPVYFDMEDVSTINSDLAQIATTWCNKIEAAGYTPGIYANTNWFTHYLTDPVFTNSGWSIWWANYNYKCDATQGTYDMWQCSSYGKIAGITGNVDVNFWCNGEPLAKMTHGSTLQSFALGDMAKVSVGDTNLISTIAHLQSYGWTYESKYLGFESPNGYQCGVTGQAKRLEAFAINSSSVSLKYRAHVQSIGWQKWVTTGQTAGTTGQAKSIQAIQIELTGSSASNYDVYYRVHCQTFGWTGWAKNGEACGSTGYSKRAEAIQVAVVPKGSSAPGSSSNAFYKGESVTYQMHQQTYGWLSSVLDGADAGIIGIAKRGEAVKISLKNPEYSGGVTYRIHQQTYGWLPYVSDGEEAGVTGLAKRAEAIQINLTGTMKEKYDVYYRVHCQTYGWLDWAKNGEVAGTTGLAKRMEAIQIVLVKKGGQAPGSTTRHCIEQ